MNTKYNVGDKDGHFPESWIGTIVFGTKEEAEAAIKNENYLHC